MKHRVAAISLLLFCSGFTALAIQVSWMREFRLVFGASTAASAAVVAIFMGGLGLGNALLGKRADAVKSPLLMYAVLELGVGVTAGFSPLLIDLARAVYIALGGQSVLGLSLATLVRLALATAVLAVPTILMGGTLPAAVRAATSADDDRRRRAGWLYGANTLGAVAGAAGSTFLLLPVLGTRSTLWLGCSLSVVVAAAAWGLARRFLGADQIAPALESTPAAGATGQAAEASDARGPAEVVPPPALAAHWVYFAAATVGFAFFLMELVWYRMLGPILAGTTYTFGLILAVALLGIGIGGALYAPIFRIVRPTARAFAFSCGLEAALIALPYALGDRLALLAAHYHEASNSFGQSVWGWAVVAGIVVLPAAIVAGVQFPLLIALLGRGERNVGRQVGYAFAWNTVGAILGSLAGGFGVLPLLTAPGAWVAVVVLLAAVALAYSMASLRLEGRSLQLAAPVGVAAVAIALVGATGPSAVWRHSGIGAGRFALPEGGENVLRDWMHKQRRRVLWEAEGVEASIGLVADDGLSFFINGKCDGHAINDAGTQLVSGVLAAMLHPKPKTAFIVGLGTGETPGWLAEVPSIERVDVVELEPAIDEMARLCSDVNHDVLDHRKVQMIYNDAREVLLTIPTRYDLIFSEPSNPWRAGIANLFTREFYLSCRDRLNDDGLFVQWVQGYEIDAQTVQTACATLRSVFGHVEIWQSKAEDMLMVCSRRPNTYKVELLRRRLEQEPYRSAMAKAWRATDLEGVLARYVGGPGLVDTMRSHENARINTDDHNVIEYGFARTVGLEETDFSVQDLRSTAIELGAHRPPVEGGGVDWRGVEDHRQLMYALWRGIVSLPPEATDEQKARTEVLRHYYANQPKQMLDTWSAAGYDPVEPTETSLLALAAASIGDGRAPRLIERVGTFNATEGAAIAGCFLMQRGQIDAAAASFARAFRGLREDPWPLSHAVELAAPAAAQVARHAPAHAPALYAAFSEPFAVYAYEERRLGVAHQIAIAIGPEPTLETLQAFEPHVPWNEGFLRLRYEVYRRTDHPLAGRAKADLDSFVENAELPSAVASQASRAIP